MSDVTTPRATERADFQATSDPALLDSADRGESQLLSYRDLYLLWERQHALDHHVVDRDRLHQRLQIVGLDAQPVDAPAQGFVE